jgi:endonuclease G
MFLTQAQFDELVQAAVDSGLIVDVPRSVLFRGLPGGFVAGLRMDPAPLTQFSLDLARFDDVERLAGGIVPIVLFLGNAASQLALRDMPQSKLFERRANEIGNRTAGAVVTSLPDPAQLPEVTQHQVIVGRDDMVDFGFLSRALATGRSVARILMPRFQAGAQVMLPNAQPWIGRGTAWIIGPKLAITNWHVVNNRSDDETDADDADFRLPAKNATVEFDFDQENSTKKPVGVDTVIHASKALDYAIVRLAEEPGCLPIALNAERVRMSATTYLPVNIIQHPGGQPKRIAFRNNLVTAADQVSMRYLTDTDRGSSGSPVCDDNWRVVALHRGAKHASGVSYQGKDTAYVNFGTQIQAILDDLKTVNAGLYAEIAGM